MVSKPWWEAFLIDAFKDDPKIVDTFTTIGIQKAFTKIPPREQEMILMYYQYKLSCKSIGEHFGVTGNRVQEIIRSNKRYMHYKWMLSTLQGNDEPIPEGTSIAELGLSTRVFNALVRRDIFTIEQLRELSPGRLVRMYHIGKAALKEIHEKLLAYEGETKYDIPMEEESKMNLKAIAKIIYVPGTMSEERNIKVVTMADNRLLWEGKAKDLQDADVTQANWNVNEIRVDYHREEERERPDYNKGKIIVVY